MLNVPWQSFADTRNVIINDPGKVACIGCVSSERWAEQETKNMAHYTTTHGNFPYERSSETNAL